MPPVSALSQQIWDMKYRLKAPSGAPVDKTLPDTWSRVARALAAPEADPAKWEPVFAEALEETLGTAEDSETLVCWRRLLERLDLRDIEGIARPAQAIPLMPQ